MDRVFELQNNAIQYKAMPLARYGVYKRLLYSRTNVTKQYSMGEMMERATEAAGVVASNYICRLPVLGNGIIHTIGIFVVLFVHSWVIGLIVVAVYPVYFWIAGFVNRRSGRYILEMSRQRAAREDVFLQGVRGMDDLRTYQREAEYLSKYDIALKNNVKVILKKQRYDSIVGAIQTFVETSLPVIMAVITVIFVGMGMLEIGAVTFVMMLVSQLLQPMNSMMSIINVWYTVKIQADRCFEMLDKCEERQGLAIGEFESLTVDIERFVHKEIDTESNTKNVNNRENGSNAESVSNQERVYGVESVEREDSVVLLQGVRFEVKKGDRVLIMASSGKGKSTLLNIISKRVELSEECGHVRINGVNVGEIDSKALFDNVSYASQDSFVFKDTLRNNIFLYGKYTEDELDEVIKICCLEDFVKEYGKDRIIESDNKNISGGQLQRICLARALITRSPLLLVDEPTSALDEDTIEQFLNNMQQYFESSKTTMICVTHNVAIQRIAQRMIEL